jgi:hypothetical protein
MNNNEIRLIFEKDVRMSRKMIVRTITTASGQARVFNRCATCSIVEQTKYNEHDACIHTVRIFPSTHCA